MKTTKAIFPLLAAFAAVLFASSCLDKEVPVTLTEQDAVYLVEASMQESTGGLSYKMEAATEEVVVSSSVSNACDSLFLKNAQFNHSGTRVKASYEIDLDYQMTCNSAGIPMSAALNYQQVGDFSSSRVTGADSANLGIVVSGLQPLAGTLSLDGNYDRSGTHTLSTMNQRNINSVLTISLAKVEVDKSNYEIISGGGTYTLKGSTANGNFSFTGTIVFLGSKMATITVNGVSYKIDLN